MKKIPTIIWPIGGIFLLLMIAGFFLFKTPKLVMVSSTTSNLIPGESLKVSDIKYSQDYKNGEGKWELKAKEAHFFDETQLVALKDVLLTFDSFKRNSFTIKGNEGEYFRKTGKIILKGDVMGNSTNGYQIETGLLIYRPKDESMETDEPIRVIGPFFRVRGDGLYVDLKREKFTVKSNVCTTITSAGVFGR
jgi:LPS export ABC transporter protein LptC